jgi:hypothetical protein
MYGIFAKLSVYFAPLGENKESFTLVDRIKGELQEKVEPFTAREFLMRIQKIVHQVGARRVIVLNRDDFSIYSPDQPREADWESAFQIALKESESSKGSEEWWILVSGSNDQFKFKQGATLKEKHSLSTPSIAIEIRALPADLAKLPGEDFETWMKRLSSALHDKDGIVATEGRSRAAMEKYLLDYEGLLKEEFPAAKFSQSLNIDLSGINLESFRENYFFEHESWSPLGRCLERLPGKPLPTLSAGRAPSGP